MNKPLTGSRLTACEWEETGHGAFKVPSTLELPSLPKQLNGYTRTSTSSSGSTRKSNRQQNVLIGMTVVIAALTAVMTVDVVYRLYG